MAVCHEIKLGPDLFSQTIEQNTVILKVSDIKVGDFILFKKVDATTEEDTGLYLMTQVTNVYIREGLVEGYNLISYKKMS